MRTKNGLSQDELAEKVFVTRQAVSRWENGDTIPNTETLKLLSKLFNYWKKYDELSDNGQFEEFKKTLIQEINDLHIEGMPKLEFILICTYEAEGKNPELVLYKKR